MDSFTENILARARERKKLLEDYTDNKTADGKNIKAISSSYPNLPNSDLSKPVTSNNLKENNSEGNISKLSKQNSSTRISSQMSSSSPQLKTLNIQNDNFNMEIKVSSTDNVRVEVQIEEQDENGAPIGKSLESGLREDAKNRLNRLGKLYGGGDDVDISSPIHRTETKFHAEEEASAPKGVCSNKSKKGLSKLADLAQNINQWEDDLTKVPQKKAATTPIKKSWKSQAPQPPDVKKQSPLKPSTKPKAPIPPKVVAESPKKEQAAASTPVKWDQKVLDSLESQGFTRTDSSSRLVYKYNSQEIKTASTAKVARGFDKENVIAEEAEEVKPKSPQKLASKIADRAAIFEASPSKSNKDPALLSVSERKALFEKNKGTALVPKAPFGMATPIKTEQTKPKPLAPKPPLTKEVEARPMVTQPGSTAHKKEIEVRPVVTQAGGIADKVAALLENKSTISQEQIESGIREQRQKEMDMLLNRFHRENEDIIEEVDDVNETTAMLTQGPAPIVSEAKSSNEKRRSSGNTRCSKQDSPKVAAVLNDVKRIKVSPKKAGRLYPSLTDIESTTETENETEDQSPTPNNSSFGESVDESDDANTSFGRDILRVVCKGQTPQKRVLMNDDSTASDMSDVLDDMDDYIDEALAYHAQNNGPTPPKQGRKSPVEPSHSFNYRSFQSDSNTAFKSPMKTISTPTDRQDSLPTHVVDGDNVLPLTHTVSFYRKQQNQNSTTPVRQISHQPLLEEVAEDQSEDQEQVDLKLAELKCEVKKQEEIISQTSRALNLCNCTPEFMGSTEQVEAERVLLLATHRRQAALHELQRLKVEKSLRPQAQQHSKNLPLEQGTLVISKIVLPLKPKYVKALAAAGGKGHHVVCLVKYAEQVVPTPLVSTVVPNAKNPDMELSIPGSIKLNNIFSDFTITFEVYCLQAQEETLPHEVKYHIKKPNSKLTPKKSKQESRLVRPIKESPGGPQAVRSPTFALMGYVVFSVQAINKRQFSLINTPSMSPLEGTVEMSIQCELASSVEHRGFLTMFEDVSGFGAWHRRWCLLKGHILSYWKYPDDERKTPPINSMSLKDSITKHVGPVSRDICARLHTFLIETERLAHPRDKDSLVTVRKGDKTIVRHLLSADTKEERIEWCNKFNAALNALHTWGKRQE